MLTRTERDSWARALRNPNIAQTKNKLVKPITHINDKPEFCCLGVYCDRVLNIPLKDMCDRSYPRDVGRSLYLISAQEPEGPAVDFERAIEDYEFDLTTAYHLADLDEMGSDYDFTEYDGTRPFPGSGEVLTKKRRIKSGVSAFADMNDTLKWSFNRIANIVENLPVKG